MNSIIWQKIAWNTLFVVNMYAIGYLWLAGSGDLLSGSDPGDIAIAFGRLTGLLLEFFILVELVLISRLTSLEQLYGFDKKNILHRRLGYFLVFFIFVHPILLILGYAARNEQPLLAQCMSFLTDWEDVANATLAVAMLFVMGMVSMPWIRRLLSYETWYFAHLPMYFAVALAFGHQTKSGDVSYGGALYYWLMLNFSVFGVVLMYRFLVPLKKNLYHQFRVSRIVRESPDVVSIYLTGKHMRLFHFEAGQWARMIFLQKDMWHGHPFSFSAPYNGEEIRFSVKALGNWTKRVEALRPGTRVWVEGPMGVLTLSKAVTEKQLFIAGGIGITPILAMVCSMRNAAQGVLYYAAQTSKELLFQDEIQKSGIACKRFVSAEEAPGCEKGFVSIEQIKTHTPDFLERDIYLCGPPPMLQSLTQALLGAGLPQEQLHVEKFSF
jgi:predicted ferric reductase